ncbi:hypothetical protein CGRA01v4_12589 [Colletotrichum graminicola]|nr:hypothetical protein CGRA01v4_12589 [Colletotrichum graminicola]
MSAGTRVEKTTCGAFASGATRANPASVVSARDADTSRAPCRSITTRIKTTCLRELCYQPNEPGWKKTCMNYPEGRLFSFNQRIHAKFSRHKFCLGNRPGMPEKGREGHGGERPRTAQAKRYRTTHRGDVTTADGTHRGKFHGLA